MWAQIKTEIFENDQMDIYEKMCLIVLISLGEDVELSSELLARYMGCTVVTAKRAFESLQRKGYLASEGEMEAQVETPIMRAGRESNVVSERDAHIEDSRQILLEPVDHFREGFFVDGTEAPVDKEVGGEPELDDEASRRARLKAFLLGDENLTTEPEKPFVSVKTAKNKLVDQVIEIIEEKISFKEANIILGFSGNDIEKIKRKYKIAKMSQVSDTIGVLINELQKPELDLSASNVIKAEAIRESLPKNEMFDENVEREAKIEMPADDSQRDNRQVNKLQILRMQAYQKQKKGPQS